jgi:hypothetical protein
MTNICYKTKENIQKNILIYFKCQECQLNALNLFAIFVVKIFTPFLVGYPCPPLLFHLEHFPYMKAVSSIRNTQRRIHKKIEKIMLLYEWVNK